MIKFSVPPSHEKDWPQSRLSPRILLEKNMENDMQAGNMHKKRERERYIYIHIYLYMYLCLSLSHFGKAFVWKLLRNI